jgi:hypothetical protein
VRLTRKGTVARYNDLVRTKNRHVQANKFSRYDLKLRDATTRLCQDRCEASVANGARYHDRDLQGRVFTCMFCQFRTCVDCDRPKHDDESCEAYRARVVQDPKHMRDLATTMEVYEACPYYRTIFELEGGCGYTQCTASGHRFCHRCMIP